MLCYAALAAYAFWLYAFGPALALLRAELRFSYAMLGVYSALWSAGAALVGVSFAALARRCRRATLMWCSAAGATAGAGLFAGSHAVALTLLGAALLGFAGTTLLTCTQAILSDRHGGRRDRALTEANVGAAACAVLAPLLLGLLQGTPAGWRVALGLPVLVLAGLYLRYRHEPLPAAPTQQASGGRARLPLACWLLAAMVAVGIAIEFCPVYFGAELLAATGLRTAQAATAMSGFYLGILSGRVGGVWLTRRAGRTVPLLCASLAVSAAGFLLFWLADQPALAITGLFLCGLGVANLYPLSLALSLAAAPGNGDAANAATQLIGGVLVIAAPYLLGSLADHLGLRTAFAIEPVLIGVCAVLLLAGLRLTAGHTGIGWLHLTIAPIFRRTRDRPLGSGQCGSTAASGGSVASVPDIVNLILADHARVRELLGELDDARVIAADPGAGHLATIWAALADLLEKHLDAAEEIAYPALLNGAARRPAAEIADDDDVREALGEARLHPAGSPLWWLAVQAAREAVISHLDTMETGPLAAFRREASPQERDVLGRRWLAFVIARADDSDGAAGC